MLSRAAPAVSVVFGVAASTQGQGRNPRAPVMFFVDEAGTTRYLAVMADKERQRQPEPRQQQKQPGHPEQPEQKRRP